MRITITSEYRFMRTPDGATWTPSNYPYPFWTQFLQVFDGVQVVARAQDVPHAEESWARCDGPQVSFAAMPYYVGPLGYARKARRMRQAAARAFEPQDAVLMYVPSVVAACFHERLARSGHPYGVHVVGDPASFFAPGAMKHPLRPLLRWWLPRQLRGICAGACTASYVTEAYLQRLYPCPGVSVGVSDVELPPEALVEEPRTPSPGVPPRLVYVGSLAQMYKAPDVLLDAVALCVSQGLPVTLTLVGEGQYRGALEAQARTLGIADRVTFTGALLAGAAVRRELDQAALFILPSRGGEGLPRALVEAMARGLPCLGTPVGGIPELLVAEDLVPVGDAAALAGRIMDVFQTPGRLAAMSVRNLSRARDFEAGLLQPRREALLRHLREVTETWLQGQGH